MFSVSITYHSKIRELSDGNNHPKPSQTIIHLWDLLILDDGAWKLSDITQFSWSIIQNKWVPQIDDCLTWFWMISITQFSDFWVMSYGNWKHILVGFSFHSSVLNCISVIKTTYWIPRSKSVATLTLFFFFTGFGEFGFFIFFFFFFLSH